MNEILKLIIYYTAIFTPYRVICYVPFYKKLRLSLAVCILIFVIFNFCHYLSMAVLTVNGVDSRVLEFASVLFCVLYFIIVKESPFKLLFFYIFILDTIIVLRGISVFLMYTFFNVSYTTEILTHSLCFIALLPFILILLKKAVTIIFEVEAPKLWRTIWLLPFVVSVIILIFTYNLVPVGDYKWKFILSRLLFAVAVLMIYGILLVSLNNIREQIMLKEKNETVNKLNSMYMTQYNTLYNHITEVKRARHDLKQHINILQSYMEKGDYKAISHYLDAYKKSLPVDIKTGYCANKTIDIILGWYFNIAEKNNIKVITNINIPARINIPDPTLSVLFGNLLENAVYACINTKLKEPFIKVCCTITGSNAFSLTVDNTCENQPVFKDDMLMSTKHSGVGYGTNSVRAIAEEYKGVVDFKQYNNVFYASVLLYIKNNE